MNMVNQVGGLKDRVHPEVDAAWFANEIDRLTKLYSPEITRSQLNLLDRHDMPRFLTCVNNNLPSLHLAMLFMFTYPGAPCLFYGDEVGLTGAQDPDCRKGFPWDESNWDHDLLNYTKAVTALRKEQSTLRRGSYQRLYSDKRVFAFVRKYKQKTLIVLLNTGDMRKKIAIPIGALITGSRAPATVFGPDTHPSIEKNALHVEVPARKGVVLRL